MQILDVEQIRAWDAYTILHEPISSLQLMERAAHSCFNWLMENQYKSRSFAIFCGKGNNGGDGLALARLLAKSGHNVSVFILEFGSKGTADFQSNLSLLHNTTAAIHFISAAETIHPLPKDAIVIDAIFGSGLNKPLTGLSALLTEHLNGSGNEIISIDLPTGLYADKSSTSNVVVRAAHTLSFQCYKLAFMMAENEQCAGKVHILDIGLIDSYLDTIAPTYSIIERSQLLEFFKKRPEFSHKGNFGHAALVAGSFGMMGAATLAATACMRSGAGKLTCHVPVCGYSIMQLALPEAMCVAEKGEEYIEAVSSLEKYNAVAIGPGLGLSESNRLMLEDCFGQFAKPMVVDADALNTIAENPALLDKIPRGSILTPHLKEFERLFGKSANDFERMKVAVAKANALELVIVLKGHHTIVAAPGDRVYFNITGNAGMAKAGYGDILTGMLLAFLSQGYEPRQSATLAVFLHGRAADIAVSQTAMEALLPTDCLQYIGAAIRELY